MWYNYVEYVVMIDAMVVSTFQRHIKKADISLPEGDINVP